MRNKYFYYTRRCIIHINFHISRNVFCYYIREYINNKYFYYTLYCMIKIHFHISRNVCCHYTLSYIITTNILLYETMYNKIFVVII